MKVKVKTNLSKLRAKVPQAVEKADHALANQIVMDTQDFVPASGAQAGMYTRTQVDGGTIIYPGPYARYLYYGKVMVDEHGRGPAHYIDKEGNEVIMFPKGSKLHPTSRDLDIKQHHHRKAQKEWFKVSKDLNLQKWLNDYRKAVTKELAD